MKHTQRTIEKCEHPPDEEAMREIVGSLIWDGEVKRALELATIMSRWTEARRKFEFISFYWLGVQSTLHGVAAYQRFRDLEQELSILKGGLFQ